MAEHVSRQHVVDRLRRMGMPQAADEAARVLPDPVDLGQAAAFCEKHGMSRDQLIDRMGGSP
ncbi:MAG TPA: hypothetical protein VG756_01085 [Pseudonocardiaceae bacterium]|jgi:hypothetical protein|nr:hypothetical protein [Pseudonocardiaceae bacterium]